MAPRAIWSGAISFGLVNVPVKLYSGTQEKSVSFHQFQEGTGERIRYKRVAESTGEEVDYSDIVKGYEFEKGRYVMVEPEELEAIAPEKSRSITIEDFVSLDQIDPAYFNKTYYLGPEEGRGAERPYALLRQALAESDKVGIGRFVMRTKEYLAAIRPAGDVLVLETMFFPDEVRDPVDLGIAPQVKEAEPREVKMAHQLIDSLTIDFDPDRYRDEHRDRVLDLIERKAAGEEIVTAAPPEQQAKVVDLMAALEASVEQARQGRTGRQLASGPSGDGNYADMTKEELYEEAQERDIPGRSKMTKDELAQALQEAS